MLAISTDLFSLEDRTIKLSQDTFLRDGVFDRSTGTNSDRVTGDVTLNRRESVGEKVNRNRVPPSTDGEIRIPSSGTPTVGGAGF